MVTFALDTSSFDTRRPRDKDGSESVAAFGVIFVHDLYSHALETALVSL